MIQPLISIIMPVFNGEKYLAEAINGCLNQTYANIEIIIVNDASTDKTLEIAEDFASKNNSIKIINNLENKKLPASLNIGHKQAKGEFITWTSDDNIYQKDAIETMYLSLLREQSDIVYSSYLTINDEGVIYNQTHTKPIEILLFSCVIGACFLYKNDVFVRNDGYNENLFLVEDYDFWLRALKHSKFSKIDNPGYYFYRYHRNSLTVKMKFDIALKNQFAQNLRNLYATLFDNHSIKDKQKLIDFFTDRYLNGPNKNIDAILSKNFFKDLKCACNSLIGVSFEKLKRIIVNDGIETIMFNKKYQNISTFIYVHKRAGSDIIFRLSIKRYFALIKKCFF